MASRLPFRLPVAASAARSRLLSTSRLASGPSLPIHSVLASSSSQSWIASRSPSVWEGSRRHFSWSSLWGGLSSKASTGTPASGSGSAGDAGPTVTESVQDASSQVVQTASTLQEEASARASQVLEAMEHATAASEPALTAITKIGDIKTLGLGSDFTPVGWIQQIMEAVYVNTSLPWFGVIITSAIGIRVLMFPLVPKQQRTAARLHNVSPELQQVQAGVQEAMAQRNQGDLAIYQARQSEIYKKAGTSPLRMLVPALLQGPVLMSFFIALRNMAETPVPGLNSGGFGWVTDLTVPDPLYILPLASVMTFAAILETTPQQAQNRHGQGMKMIMRLFMLPFAYVSLTFPAAMLVYFLTSNTWSLCQQLFFQTKFARRLFDIPEKLEFRDDPINKTSKPLGFLGSFKAVQEMERERRDMKIKETQKMLEKAKEKMREKAEESKRAMEIKARDATRAQELRAAAERGAREKMKRDAQPVVMAGRATDEFGSVGSRKRRSPHWKSQH